MRPQHPLATFPRYPKAPVPVVTDRGCAAPGPQPTIGLPRALHDARPEPVNLVRRELHAANVDAGTDPYGLDNDGDGYACEG